MKEIIYTFQNLGGYVPAEAVRFQEESCLRLIIEPHDFEMKISGEVIRSSNCKGYKIEVSRQGAVRFFDYADHLLAATEETEKTFPQVRFLWKQDWLQLQFGCVETVDNYPNCDGEYDRWSEEWVTQRLVVLNLKDNMVEIQ